MFADPGALRRAVDHMKADHSLCAIGFRITNFHTRDNDWTSWDYPPERDPPTGTWRVRAFTDPKRPAIGEASFLVEDYVADRL